MAHICKARKLTGDGVTGMNVAPDNTADYIAFETPGNMLPKFIVNVFEKPFETFGRMAAVSDKYLNNEQRNFRASINKLIIIAAVIMLLLFLLSSLNFTPVAPRNITLTLPEITVIEPAPEPVINTRKPVSTAKRPAKSIVAAAAAPAPRPVEAAPIPATNELQHDAVETFEQNTSKDFVKISLNGVALSDDTNEWSCVEDGRNGLAWEVKTRDGGWRDRNHSYSWFNTSGARDGGRCTGVACDTASYVQAMNQNKVCGYSDWRLPTRSELESLVDFHKQVPEPTINQNYFPQALASWYWTASSNQSRPDYAWYVLFRNGIALNDLKTHPKHIRLVRGEAAE